MKIGIDARALESINKTGIQYYVKNLVNALARVDTINDYILYFNSLTKRNALVSMPNKSNFSSRQTRVPSFLPENTLYDILFNYYLPGDLRFRKIDVFHGLDCCIPATKVTKKVVTVHDMVAYMSATFMPINGIQFYKKWTNQSMKLADVIIAVSEYTGNNIIKYCRVSPKKIRVVHLGVDTQIFYQRYEDNEKREFIKKHNLQDRFVLYVGGICERKNVASLIKAYHLLKSNNDIDYGLVLAGVKGFGGESILNLINVLGLTNRVRYLGYMKEEELPLLYNCAELFVFPSFDEGFGLPVLEAMACGVPVIVSKVAALPEVVGDGGLLIDPNNIAEIAGAIKETINNAGLKKELREKGFRRARLFSWDLTAEKTIKVYQEIV